MEHSKLLKIFQIASMSSLSLVTSKNRKSATIFSYFWMFSMVIFIIFYIVLISAVQRYFISQNNDFDEWNDFIKTLASVFVCIIICCETIGFHTNRLKFWCIAQRMDRIYDIGLICELKKQFKRNYLRKFIAYLLFMMLVECYICFRVRNDRKYIFHCLMNAVPFTIVRLRQLEHSFYIGVLNVYLSYIRLVFAQLTEETTRGASRLVLMNNIKLCKQMHISTYEMCLDVNKMFGLSQAGNLAASVLQLTIDLLSIYSFLSYNNQMYLIGNAVEFY